MRFSLVVVENYEIKDRFIAGNVVQKAEDVKAWIDREEERIKNFPGYDGIEPYIAMAQDSLAGRVSEGLYRRMCGNSLLRRTPPISSYSSAVHRMNTRP